MSSIHERLVAVTRQIAQGGIGKTRKNTQQGYNFRGIDEVMNAFAPILAAHGLFIRPRFTEREFIERQTKNGGALFYVTVKGEFDFVSDGGEAVTVGPFYGEAMDSADKATNKAMAVAFKYALFQTFCVPLEGVTGGDADEVTHEVAARRPVSTIDAKPTAGVWEAQTEESQAFLLKVAAQVKALLVSDGAASAADHLQAQGLDTDEKAAIWTRFESSERTALTKAMKASNQEKAA